MGENTMYDFYAILFSLIITIISYGLFPVAFSKTRKQFVTKRKYKWLCFGINYIVSMVFVVIRGGFVTLAPYFLWTSIFYSYGVRELGRRGVMPESNHFKAKNGQIIECKKCGYKEKHLIGPCPRCNSKKLQFVCYPMENQEEKTISQLILPRKIELVEKKDKQASNNIWVCGNCNTKNMATNDKCWSCGNKNINNETYFCSKCGVETNKDNQLCVRCETEVAKEK